MTRNYIDKKNTDIIKGIAICMMLIHHFFTFPSWYHEYSYPYMNGFAAIFQDPFKSCVAIFAFLTGYFYCYNKKKNLKYSLKKITDLLISHFVVLVLLCVISIVLKCYDFSFQSLGLELLGLQGEIMVFSWYVSFYIISLVLIPFFAKLADKHILAAISTGVLLPIILLYIYNTYFKVSITPIDSAINSLDWFSVMAMGYIFARYEVFYRVFDAIFYHKIPHFLQIIISVLLLFFAFMGRHILSGVNLSFVLFGLYLRLDIIYAPLFIYALINLLNCIKWKSILFPLKKMGEYSLYIWFIHAVFFNCCGKYTQKLLYFPKNPFLVFVWGALICFGAAVILSFPSKLLIFLKNRLLFKKS